MWERIEMAVVKIVQIVFLWLPILVFSKFFLRLRVVGWENLYHIHTKAFIVVSNHTSYIDAYLVADILARASLWRFLPVFAIMDDEYFRNILQKWFFLLHGAFPAQKGTGLENSTKTPIRLLQKGVRVVIFPAGALARKGRKRNPRRGVAYVASETNIPLVPFSIQGFNPFRFLWGFSLKDIFTRSLQITIVIGPHFFLSDLVPFIPKTKRELRQASERVMERVHALNQEKFYGS